GRERYERQPEQKMQIGPKHRACDSLDRMKHVMMVVPVNTEVDEAQHVAQEHGDQRRQRFDVLAVGHLQLQYHDGDDDGDHAIAKCFKSALSHECALVFAEPQCSLIDRTVKTGPLLKMGTHYGI